ncbi:hypothetical protein TFLX_06557 [Thermoflexales bacterium]|nr:hypothetical protein TFLX_06557 [Thermoflexales bacterium]
MAIDKRLPGPKTYVDLMPSGKFEQKLNLSALYGFPPSLQVKNHSVGTGKYMIQAIYQNQEKPDDAVDVWQGEVKSDSILITIQ